MFSNRLKLGQKRKDSAVLKPTKLNLASLERGDFENLENHDEAELIETTEVIKSSPNIQLCSPKLFPFQISTVASSNQATNRPLSHRDHSKTGHQKTGTNSETKELSQCKSKLEENQVKMEECKSIVNELTLENDLLKNQKKILQAELSNFSKDYYERQIARLKDECQKYQIECLTIQHKMDSFSQDKGQLEASNRKRADEIKNYIKQLQKQKLTVIELKNQVNQRERTFKYALEESERSNEILNKNHFELTQKNIKLQAEIREKNKVIDSLNNQNQIVTTRFKQCEGQIALIRKRYEEIITEKQSKIVAIENNHRQIVKELEQKIRNLINQLTSIKENQSQRAIQIAKISLDIKAQQQSMDKSLIIARFQQQTREFRLTLQSKDNIIASLEQKLKEYFTPDQYSNLEKKFKEAQDKRMSSAKYYEEKLYNLQKQNEKLKFEKLSVGSTSGTISGASKQKDVSVSFNDILRRSIEETTAIKEQLKLKIDQNQEIKAEMIDIKLKEKKYINQIEILMKRLQSQDKNTKIELQVERQKFSNDLDSLRRKLHTFETRLEYKISENKQKDDFIKNTIIGRSKSSDVPFIIAELERIFLERQKFQITKQ